MQTMIMALICVPFLMALVIAVVHHDTIRAGLVYLFGAAIAVMAIVTAVNWYMSGQWITFDLPGTEIFDKVILVGDFVLMALVIWLSFKYKKGIISILSIVQTVMVAYAELNFHNVVETSKIRVDGLAVVMILVIGIVGVAIGIYAIGYLRGYHRHHKDYIDRRSYFLALVFVFYGAMFGLVTSASLIWMYFFWEITSICSFLLIGYTKTEEAINNSFRALWMNLLGGLGIACAVTYAMLIEHTYDLSAVISGASNNGILLPIALLAFACLTKSAQMPFSGWLLGAMVAPTPSSALLHSATMVKAGVYLLIRLAPCMQGTTVGQMVYLVGGFTFFMTSLLAISQSDAKKVLAYSTISNLGLIVACTGIGSPETMWAALFLLLFHAVSKSMLFQCVGAVENASGSRDIEDMQGLAWRLPKLAFIMIIGIAGMFLAPFGMLVSKWAALQSFINAKSAIMVLFICFGSASTMFYWTKWLSKLLGKTTNKLKDVTEKNEYVSMFLHAALVILLCFMIPVLSAYVVQPIVVTAYGASTQVLSSQNIMIMTFLICALVVVPLISFLIARNARERKVLSYMGGANGSDNRHFISASKEDKRLYVANWYMDNWFGEDKLLFPSMIGGIVIIVIFLAMVLGGAA